ncbi:MAG TPA: hypothetical protein VNN18_00205 [Candidatus Xenobia bacterium]|nr:hypothetical protein [Candidatus Xenobia bacterium]
MSIDVKDTPVKTVAALLSRSTGKRVEVISGGDRLVSLNLINVPVRQAIRLLQQSAPGVSLSIDGQAIQNVQLSPEAQISVCFTDAELSSALALLAEVTGAKLGAASAPGTKVTLKTQGTLGQIVAQLRVQSGVDIQLQQ